MLDQSVIEGLRARYPDIHPLLFHRSVERAKSGGNLFDILEAVPKTYPLYWCDREGGWVATDDLYLTRDFADDAV